MNSEDVRTNPYMKAYMAKWARKRRMAKILFIGEIAVIAAIFITGCPSRWPIIITGGGHGGVNGDTLEGGK